MKKLIIFLLSLFMLTAVGYAQEMEISVTIPDTFMHVQYHGKAYFNFTIKNNLSTATQFDISYSLSTDNEKKEYGKANLCALNCTVF